MKPNLFLFLFWVLAMRQMVIPCHVLHHKGCQPLVTGPDAINPPITDQNKLVGPQQTFCFYELIYVRLSLYKWKSNTLCLFGMETFYSEHYTYIYIYTSSFLVTASYFILGCSVISLTNTLSMTFSNYLQFPLLQNHCNICCRYILTYVKLFS